MDQASKPQDGRSATDPAEGADDIMPSNADFPAKPSPGEASESRPKDGKDRDNGRDRKAGDDH